MSGNWRNRRWRIRILAGTAIVVALGAGGTAMAMASEPGGPGGPGGTVGGGDTAISGTTIAQDGTAGGGGTAVLTTSGGPGTQVDPNTDPLARCLKAHGAKVTTRTNADGGQSVTITLDPSRADEARNACARYEPQPRPTAITPLTAAQKATVVGCLRSAGIAFPAAGTSQSLGVPAQGGPGAPGRPGIPGAAGGQGGISIRVTEPGDGDGPAPADQPRPPAPDPKLTAALGKCARATGLPGLALTTESGSAAGHESNTIAVLAARAS
jgi:hypothetical protein